MASAYGTKPSQLSNPVPSTEAPAMPSPVQVPRQVIPAGPPASFPVGQAPWESSAAPSGGGPADSYPVGEAPWEQEEPGFVSKALDYGARVLDYAGGPIRGGLAEWTGLASGKGSIVTPEDMHKMLKGKGPNSAEYLERLGVGEGLSTPNLPILGKVTQRGVEGFALDVITDPLTVVGKAVKALPEGFAIARKILGLGADVGAEAIGKYIYKSGFSKIDAKMVENGAEPLSKMLLESGGAPSGTTAQIAKKVQAISDTMGKMRDGLYQKATDLGVTVDLSYPLKNAEEFIETMSKDKRVDVRTQAAELSQYLERNYKAAGSVDLATLSQWKTDLYHSLPNSFFGPNGRMVPVGKQFNALLAKDFKQAIVDGGNAGQKGLGDSIEAINDKWGTLLDARKPMAQQVKQAAGKSIVSPIKGALAASGHIPAALAMEAVDMAKTTAAQTVTGKTLMKGAEYGVPGDLARRKLIDSQRSKP